MLKKFFFVPSRPGTLTSMLGEPPHLLLATAVRVDSGADSTCAVKWSFSIHHSATGSRLMPSSLCLDMSGECPLLSSERTVGKLSLGICDLESATLLTPRLGGNSQSDLCPLEPQEKEYLHAQKFFLCSFKTWNIDKYAGGAPHLLLATAVRVDSALTAPVQ